MAEVYHALGLNMHQPPGNLLSLHNSDERWEARQILWCYDRPTRMIEGYEDIARVHMSFSCTLAGTLGFTPVHISEYIDKYPPTEEVEVYRGAWNTGHHWGGDFAQWTGSLLQKRGLDELRNASAYYNKVKVSFEKRQSSARNPEELRRLITEAYDHILVAETSCNFYWGSRWVHRSFDDLEKAYYLLDRAMEQLGEKN